MHRSAAQLMIIVGLLGLFLMRESRQDPAQQINARFVDWLSANASGPAHAKPPVTLVEINDTSMGSQHPWPWSPLDFALFLQATLPLQPGVVAIEHILKWDEKSVPTEAQQKHRQYEKILHDFILKSPKIILGAHLGFPADPEVIPPLEEVPTVQKVSGPIDAIPEFTVIEHQPKEELRLAAVKGFINLPPAQRTVRRAPLLFRYRGQVVPSFILQAVMHWQQLTLDDISVRTNEFIALGDQLKIPIDAGGYMAVNFKAPLTRFGYDDLLLAVEQLAAGRRPVAAVDLLRHQVVILARTDAAARVLRLSAGRRGSSGELFASAIATIQTQAFLRRVGSWFEFGVIGAVMLLSSFVGRWATSTIFILSIVGMTLYFMIALALFGTQLIVLPLVLPGGLVLFLMVFSIFAPKHPRSDQTR